MSFIKNEKIDFICTHPPYANIIKYSNRIEGDISLLNTTMFFKEISKVAVEAYRVLKKGKWINVERNFLMLAHEYIFVFYK